MSQNVDIEVIVGAPYQVDVAFTTTNVRPLWRGAWSSIVTYAKDNIVKYEGSAWISIANGNLNQIPDLTPLSWELLVEKGDVGAAGPGGADAYYRHVQGAAATVWTITHGLAKRPSVSVTDSAGTKVYGDVEYLNDNQVRLTFSSAFAGEALFS